MPCKLVAGLYSFVAELKQFSDSLIFYLLSE